MHSAPTSSFTQVVAGRRWARCTYSNRIQIVRLTRNSKSAEDTDALLKHQAYIDTLPADLLTPLFFTGPEFELLLGTNLYNATIERKANWLDWWRGALDYLKGVHLTAEEFTRSVICDPY